MEGRIVQIAFQGSSKANVDFRRIMLKRLHHTGSTLRARAIEDKAAIARDFEAKGLPLIVAGKVKPVIFKTFPLREAAAAHALMETSAHIGKIVLTL
jgi:NADPH2:quinone reductase